MRATVDISLYPLDQNYEEEIIDFILRLRENKDLKVQTNGMSTQVTGEYDKVMEVLSPEMKASLLDKKAVFVLKISSGERTTENLPEILQ